MPISHERIASIMGPAVKALRPRDDVLRARRVDRAITDDGRVRLTRVVGVIPRSAEAPVSAESVQTEPTLASTSPTAQEQFSDQAQLAEVFAPVAVDTPSIDMTTTPTASGTEISGVVIPGAHHHDTGTFVYQRRVASAITSPAIGTIPAHTALDFPVVVAGVQANQVAGVGAPAQVPDGLTWCAFVSNPGEVTLRVANITSLPIVVGTLAWRVGAWE